MTSYPGQADTEPAEDATPAPEQSDRPEDAADEREDAGEGPADDEAADQPA